MKNPRSPPQQQEEEQEEQQQGKSGLAYRAFVKAKNLAYPKRCRVNIFYLHKLK